MKLSRIRELRKERGYTQVKMQMLTGIDQSAYSKIGGTWTPPYNGIFL